VGFSNARRRFSQLRADRASRRQHRSANNSPAEARALMAQRSSTCARRSRHRASRLPRRGRLQSSRPSAASAAQGKSILAPTVMARSLRPSWFFVAASPTDSLTASLARPQSGGADRNCGDRGAGGGLIRCAFRSARTRSTASGARRAITAPLIPAPAPTGLLTRRTWPPYERFYAAAGKCHPERA